MCPDTICYKIQFVPDTICSRYSLFPIQFVTDTICADTICADTNCADTICADTICTRKLNRRLKTQVYKDVGLLPKGDERFYRNFNDSSIEMRVNMLASFQYNGTCHTCLSGPHDAWQGRDGQPVVVVAGDHHFPANIPARGDGEYIRILRVENGSLAEITGELVRLSPGGGGVVPGTVIMLRSAVMLGVESVAHYAAEWKRCPNIIKHKMGEVISSHCCTCHRWGSRTGPS